MTRYHVSGLNTRVKRSDLWSGSNGVQQFRRDGVGVTAPVLSTSSGPSYNQTWGTNYVPGLSVREGGTSTYQSSGIKNVDAQSSSGSAVSATREYDAWGNVYASTGTHVGRFGYGGGFGYQEEDSGVKLLGHRFYDSKAGRFLTRDRIKDGRNWYAYCDNNPIKCNDADGLQKKKSGKSKKVVIVMGEANNAYEAGVQEMILQHMLERLRNLGYDDIVVIYNPGNKEAQNQLKDADAVVVIGHGTYDKKPGGKGFGGFHGMPAFSGTDGRGNDDSWVPNNQWIAEIMAIRNGKPFDFVWYVTCFGWYQHEKWKGAAKEFHGSGGACNQWTWPFPYKEKNTIGGGAVRRGR